MADLEQALLAAEHVGCLRPVTPHLQGPDPDDTPEPCGRCPLCVVIRERDAAHLLVDEWAQRAGEARAERDRLVDGVAKFGGLLVGWETSSKGERLVGGEGLYAAFRELRSLLGVATDDRASDVD